MKTVWTWCAVGIGALVFTVATASGQITERQLQAGLGILPEEARAGAEVLVMDGDKYRVLRAGSNGWSCRIWTPMDRLAANCHHSVLAGKLDFERELSDSGLSGAEIRERLGAALRTGRVAIPAGSVEVTGSGAVPEGGEVPDVMAGYYFVYFPFATTGALGVPAEDPGEGRPWVHNGGTADAHIMWTRSHSTDGH